MTRSLSRPGLSLASLALIVGLAGCDSGSEIEPSGNTINVGFIGDFEGEYGVEGQNTLDGIRAAAATYPYLANGDKLEIVPLPEGPTPQDTREAIQELDKEHEVTAILVGSASSRIIPVKGSFETAGIPALAIIATHEKVTQGTRFVSQMSYTNIKQGTVAALFTRDELLLRRAAVIHEPDVPYSVDLAQIFREKFLATGGDITGFLAYDGIDETALRRLSDAGTEMLFLPMSAGKVIDIVGRATESGWNPTTMGTDGLLANVIRDYPDDADVVDGMYSTDVISYEGEFISLNELGRAAQKQFFRIFGHEEADTYHAMGVEAYAILLQAMNRCEDPTDRECVNNKLRTTRDFKGVISRLSINPDGTSTRPVFVNKIIDAELHSVVQVY